MNVRSHLVRLVFAVLVPLAVLSAALVVHVSRQERASNQVALLNMARALSQGIDTEVSRTVTALLLLAESEALRRGEMDRFRERMERAMRIHGRWSNVVLFSADGKRLVNLKVPPGEPPPEGGNNIPWRAAIEARGAHISNAFNALTTGKPAVSVVVPVWVEGEAQYVIAAVIEHDRWKDVISAQLPRDWIAAIDDRNGTIFARSERPEAFVGRPAAPAVRALYGTGASGTGKSTNREGLDIELGFHTSPLTGWHTLVIVPSELLEASSRRSLLLWGAGTALIFALAMAFAFYAARPLSRGIGDLRGAVEAVGRSRRPELPPSTVAEVQAAGATIREVARTLEQRALEVAQLQQQLSERAEAAEEAGRLKDRFLGMLGHELRNPLAAIGGAAAVLARLGEGDVLRMAQIVQRQTRHLASLVDDLLDVSRAAAGKMDLRRAPTDLAAIAGEALESFAASGGLARHRIESRLAPAPVDGDVERLSQVVRNLLDNAARYTPAGGSIRVATGCEAGRAWVEVADDGVGIDPHLLQHLFEPFVQGPQNLERETGGLGLGLAITRHIVQRHGGEVVAQSAGPGRGASFRVSLPEQGPAPAPKPAAAPAAPHAVRRVAVIEDHDDSRRSLVALLASRGHEVLEAIDGESGLALLAGARPEVALVDIGLPGIDGYEVVRRARAAGVAARLVALTGYGQEADRARALAAGFDEFLVKPASVEDLEAALGGGGHGEEGAGLQRQGA